MDANILREVIRGETRLPDEVLPTSGLENWAFQSARAFDLPAYVSVSYYHKDISELPVPWQITGTCASSRLVGTHE